MADELFAGFTPTSPTPPPKPPEETPVSAASSDASSLLNFGAPTVPQAVSEPVPATTLEVSDSLLTPKTDTVSTPTPRVVPVPDALLHMISDAEVAVTTDTPSVPSETILTDAGNQTPEESKKIDAPVVTAVAVSPKSTDPRLEGFIKDDPIYQEMLRTVDAQRIRLSLALRYALLMFGIFLVFAWIVNNRVIMFGFSEFVWLARIRDGLFGLMAGLFSATLWYGSPVWFHNILFVMVIRAFACVFFLGVLSALYFPIL